MISLTRVVHRVGNLLCFQEIIIYLELLGPRTVASALRVNLSEPETTTMELDNVDGGPRHIEAENKKGI